MKVFLIVLGSVFGALLLFVLWFTVSALLVSTKKEYDSNSRYYRFMLNLGTSIGIFLTGIRVRPEGTEKMPGGRFLLVSNHRSNFDPIVTWHVFKKEDLAFISKEKNFHVPWFGRFIRRCCFMSIDREDPRKAIRTINKAAKFIESDEVSVGVYPEGTRNKQCKGLLPFHNGVFMIAQKAKVPVVVLFVYGTENVQHNFFRRRTNVTLKVIDVIDAETVCGVKSDVIGERVRNDLLSALEEQENPEGKPEMK